ncbi:sodium:calcium antiporter [Micromonospora carbonacea]|uniref:Cation:H+ antiporter n=1 Tax=Micromonospora carbonacea TaxID=47853 RepID=A0A1C4ZVS1_9ACTN|nr:sodium:proton exchanger [Micromonospora carbonacea]SCF37045.1 cation:H+ antiporter [Micromonospora carbonacea]
MSSILLFIIGAALLIFSAEKLISYLVGAASGLRVSVFLLAIIFTGIEFDDVAFGVALNLEDLSGVALGTVFGTAISMIGVVLALAAIISPTRIAVPGRYLALFAAAPLVLIPFLVLGPLTPLYGVPLLLLFGLFLGYVARRELRTGAPTTGRTPFVVPMPFDRARPLPGWAAIGLAVVALVGLVVGAAMTSIGTEGLLEEFRIAGALFGATIATLVLTLEDVLLTVEPTRRGAADIGIANVVGSVVFGVTGKLGIILLAGGSIVVDDGVLAWHLPVLVGMTALAACFLSTGRLRRWHGYVLLATYVAYWVVSFAVFGEAPVEAD